MSVLAPPPSTPGFPVVVSFSCRGGHHWFVPGTCLAGVALSDTEHGPFCPACFALAEVLPDNVPEVPALMPVLMRDSWREQFVGTPEGFMLHRDVAVEFAEQG